MGALHSRGTQCWKGVARRQVQMSSHPPWALLPWHCPTHSPSLDTFNPSPPWSGSHPLLQDSAHEPYQLLTIPQLNLSKGDGSYSLYLVTGDLLVMLLMTSLMLPRVQRSTVKETPFDLHQLKTFRMSKKPQDFGGESNEKRKTTTQTGAQPPCPSRPALHSDHQL